MSNDTPRTSRSACSAAALQRDEAAAHLWTIRSAARARRLDDESIEWTAAAMPDARAAQRTLVRALLAQSQPDRADTAAAAALAHWPRDATLHMLRAKALLLRDRPLAAQHEIHVALDMRPHHIETLRTAANIATARRDPVQAVRFLEQALRYRPHHTAVRTALIRALLVADAPDAAARVLADHPDPDAMLMAQVFEAQGRLRDAVDTLRGAARTGDAPEARIALLDLLERIGDIPALRAEAWTTDDDHPALRRRIAEVMLFLGRFDRAISRAETLLRDPIECGPACEILTVANAMIGDVDEARRMLVRLRCVTSADDPVALARQWRRGMHGRTLEQLTRGVRANDTPPMIRGLAARSMRTLAGAIEDPTRPMTPARRDELVAARDACAAVINQPLRGPAPETPGDEPLHQSHAA